MEQRLQVPERQAPTIWLLVGLILLSTGCTRRMYRRQADREANYLIREKSVGTPWQIPDTYTVQPDPRSRFFDPTDPERPTLPPAGPHLYQYQLPQLSSRMDGQAEPLPATDPVAPPPPGESGEAPELLVPPVPPPPAEGPPAESTTSLGAPALTSWGQPVSSQWIQPIENQEAPPNAATPRPLAAAPKIPPGGVQLASFQEAVKEPAEDPPQTQDDVNPFADDFLQVTKSGRMEGMVLQAIGAQYWNELPDKCLERMLEFSSIREEYTATFGQPPTDDMLDDAPRFTLRQLFELALINSREYQRQKEVLYEAALAVSLERFAYTTKFFASGNGVDTTYTHSRNRGTTVNTLAVPSTLGGNRLLATGGTLVGRFANDILLTFNGPTGFAADVGSDLLFDITQSVFQRDIILNGLIQSERNLVYAARRFARFRKEFFLSIADSYYDILLNYRSIEIQSQNYFSQVRNLQQAQAEAKSGISNPPPMVQVNQFEQGVLNGQSSLLSICNGLEQALDSYKISLGLPTETPINLNLAELERLTRRDLIEVYREQAGRWQRRVSDLREAPSPETHADLLSADKELSERLIKWLNERAKANVDEAPAGKLMIERARFRLDAARLDALAAIAIFKEVQTATPPRQRFLVYRRQAEAIAAMLILVDRQGKFAYSSGIPPSQLDTERSQFRDYESKFAIIQEDLANALDKEPQRVIIDLMDRSTTNLANLQTLSQNLDDLIFGDQVESVELAETIKRTDQLVDFASQSMNAPRQGLPEIDMSFDEAMVTALVQRLDLMNERGLLADDWRDIKIAADELRSVLNLNASQRLSTEKNRPFAFSTRNAQTRLGLSWDLPLNRKSQRNSYRRSLINYNVGLRGLMRFEDDIKLEVRNRLRSLELARQTYPIAVTQAALAEEQVLSIRLQLIFGSPEVRALDLLAAYDDSRQSLFATAQERIRFITNRARFALSLEVMMLDDSGFWPEISDAKYQPEPDSVYPWNAGSAYGEYPSFLKVSREFRRMLNYPPPGADPAMLDTNPKRPAEENEPN